MTFFYASEAKKLLDKGLLDTAAQLLEKIVEENSGDFQIVEMIGLAYLAAGEPEKAAQLSRRLLAVQKEYELTGGIVNGEPFNSLDAEYYSNSSHIEKLYSPGDEYIGSKCAVEELGGAVCYSGKLNTLDTGALTSDTDVLSEGSQKLDFREGVDTCFDFDLLKSEGGLLQDIEDSDELQSYYIPAPEEDTLDAADLGIGELLDRESQPWEDLIFDDKFADLDEAVDYEKDKYQGRLTLQEYALQIVADMAQEFEIEDDLFDQIVNVLVFHKCHGQTKKALRILLAEGIRSSELEQIFELREYWLSKEGFSRTYYGDTSGVAYTNLSWKLGLAIIQKLGCEDVYEAILYIEDCFEDWCQSPRLLNGFHSFREYMFHLIGHMELNVGGGMAPFIDYQLFPDDEALAADFPGSTVYKWLEENQLLHGEVVSWYPDPVKGYEDEDEDEDEEQDKDE